MAKRIKQLAFAAMAFAAACLAQPAAAIVPVNPSLWTEQIGRFLACEPDTGLMIEVHDQVDIWEPEADQRGLGSFAVRCTGEAKPVFLQAPHSITDLHTGEIVQALFASGNFAAMALSLVPRGDTTDQAHVPGASFQLAAEAFAYHATNGAVVQLHGFAREKRRGMAAQSANIILSDGTQSPPDILHDVAACLGDTFSDVLVYPFDTDELGGTTNTVGNHLRTVGFDHFYHVEFSYEARQLLLKQGAPADTLAQCLMYLGRDPVEPIVPESAEEASS